MDNQLISSLCQLLLSYNYKIQVSSWLSYLGTSDEELKKRIWEREWKLTASILEGKATKSSLNQLANLY